ncbi:class I SAM-dependent methyltransferase [Paenirhodobacter populi]|nr:class I SAM-dependent methyltransferase [Sinirhodobacter populi]
MQKRDQAEAGPHTRIALLHKDTVATLSHALHKARARRVIDLGCGDGTIAAALAAEGFSLTGVDPSAGMIATARKHFPDMDFLCGRAEELPQGLPRFDAAYFVNALHHVPEGAMEAALMGAVNAVGGQGVVLVIEPLAQGSFFRAMRPVEDETRVRARAETAIESLISDGRLMLRDLSRWNRESRFHGLEDFVQYLARVLPERAEIARRNEAALARAWRDNLRSAEGMAVLVQPMVCWTLAAGPAARPEGARS